MLKCPAGRYDWAVPEDSSSKTVQSEKPLSKVTLVPVGVALENKEEGWKQVKSLSLEKHINVICLYL